MVEPHDGSWNFCSNVPCVTAAYNSFAKASHVNKPDLNWMEKCTHLIGEGTRKVSYRATVERTSVYFEQTIQI